MSDNLVIFPNARPDLGRHQFTPQDIANGYKVGEFIARLGFGGRVERHTDHPSFGNGPGFDQFALYFSDDEGALAAFTIERHADGVYRSFDLRGDGNQDLIAEGPTFEEVAALWLR